MSVVVYPRLGQLLEQRKLSVAELERQIETRFGLRVNVKSLYRLTQAAPVQRADLEIAGATAAILGVGLDDLFTVETVAQDDEAQHPILGPAESQRMADLIAWQGQRSLTDEEWSELEGLVGRYGQLLHERRVAALARERGLPIEQVRREIAAQLAEARAWWEAFAHDPERETIIAEQAAALRARWPE